MFIIRNDETDKLNLPFHSNHRHRYVDRQGQQVVIHKGGEFASGVRGITLQKQKKSNFLEPQTRTSDYGCHIKKYTDIKKCKQVFQGIRDIFYIFIKKCVYFFFADMSTKKSPSLVINYYG